MRPSRLADDRARTSLREVDAGGVRRDSLRWLRRLIAAGIVAANAIVLIWLWLHDGGISSVHSGAELLTSLGRITGLLGAYALLIQVLLLARARILDRLVGFDRLTVWHRINGKLCLYLILAHVGLVTAGYALTDRISWWSELTTLLTQYPGMIDAAIGTGLLVLVVATSIVIVRRRLRYGLWYLVHLTAYAAVALAWFHQLPTGLDFITNPGAAQYWTALYLVTLALLLLFRLALPAFNGFRYQLRVAEVVEEGPKVVSLRITGRHLDRMKVQAGQFFLWRFLTWKLGWESHPFSLSSAPDGRSLRITVKSLGDFTSRMGEIKPGTRVVGVGPFGLFTAAQRSRDRVALIAGGVGITPIRALLEEMTGDVVLVYRVASEDELVFRDELEELAKERGVTLHYVTGHHRAPGAERLLTAEHLRELIPDIARREVYICGPPAMSDLAEIGVRRAGVPGKYIHTEAFAFSPSARGWKGLAYLPTRVRFALLALSVAALGAIAARFALVSTKAVALPATPTVAAQPTAVPTAQPTAGTIAQPTAVKPAATAVTAQFTGPQETIQYGPVQVTITTKGKKIISVDATISPNDPRSQSIQGQAIPILKQETLQAQSAQINTVSGATEISDAYIQSLQGALSKAGI